MTPTDRWWLAALVLAYVCGAMSGWIVRARSARRERRVLLGERL